jgi:transposase-like protein
MSQLKTTTSNGRQTTRLTQPDPEITQRAKRRQFSAADKERILEEADACCEPGQIGALLRREGIYSSYLSDWRRTATTRITEPTHLLGLDQASFYTLMDEHIEIARRVIHVLLQRLRARTNELNQLQAQIAACELP